MSNTHDQAMHFIYRQVLERLLEHLTQAQRASLQLLIQRLLVAAGGVDYVGQFQLVVVHGPDRKSALLLACLRAAQLIIAQRAPATFRMRVLVTSLPISGPDSLKHHERCFSQLFMQDDPRIDLLMIQGHALVPFSSRPVTSAAEWAQTRESLLLFGHLNQGRPEAIFGSRLHLQLAEALDRTLEGHDGVAALVTIIPQRQRQRYLAWCRRCLRLAGEPGLSASGVNLASWAEPLRRLHDLVAAPLAAACGVPPQAGGQHLLRVITVDELLEPEGVDDQLERMLDLHFSVTACDAPLAGYFEADALAQLRLLRDRMLLRKAQGRDFRLGLRRRGKVATVLPFERGSTRFLQALDLNHNQLICLLCAPFANHGRGLAEFIECFHPGMLIAVPHLHRALRGNPSPSGVTQWLMEISGLSLKQLKAIYARQVGQPARRMLVNLARRDLALRLMVHDSRDH
ncbi:hypothetical protein J2W83_002059 [Pseudomonas hunanensis]|uniref:Uncharacterized protein n=1 Tax=Pseudomonas hunanensis TaxID=1247546 RepID=A0ACC6K1Z4_9PSED|nr:hypothetical protein [Pseudomonas hunanensis]MDR6712458.1 hypothetical protein [Pseudomonas hunanensis]